jgi:hypothetical protein
LFVEPLDAIRLEALGPERLGLVVDVLYPLFDFIGFVLVYGGGLWVPCLPGEPGVLHHPSNEPNCLLSVERIKQVLWSHCGHPSWPVITDSVRGFVEGDFELLVFPAGHFP